MAADTLALIDDAHIVHAHIFPYSARDGTPAARMPQVPIRSAANGPLPCARPPRAAVATGWRRRSADPRRAGRAAGTRGHAPDFADIHFTPATEPGRITAFGLRRRPKTI